MGISASVLHEIRAARGLVPQELALGPGGLLAMLSQPSPGECLSAHDETMQILILRVEVLWA